MGMDVVDFHLADLIEVHLIDGEVIKTISPRVDHFLVRGLTAAGHRYLGIDQSGLSP